jgi:hypothetical protein
MMPAAHTMETELAAVTKTLLEHETVTKAKIFDVKTYYVVSESVSEGVSWSVTQSLSE